MLRQNAASVIVFTDCASRPNRKQSMHATFHNIPGQLIKLRGVTLHVVEQAARTPTHYLPPAVLIHGKFGSVHDFMATSLVSMLTEQQRVLLVDRPGCGYSRMPAGTPATLETQMHLLAQLLAALEVEPAVLVGHSIGASLALALATHYPERVAGLVLLAPYAIPSDGPAHARVARLLHLPVLGAALMPLVWSMVRLAARPMFRAAFAPDPMPQHYIRYIHEVVLRPEPFRADLESVLTADVLLNSIRNDYARLWKPVVIMTGTADQTATLERQTRPLAALLPRVMLLEVPEAGHMLPYCIAPNIAGAVLATAAAAELLTRAPQPQRSEA